VSLEVLDGSTADETIGISELLGRQAEEQVSCGRLNDLVLGLQFDGDNN
jgi:hypothetical protein